MWQVTIYPMWYSKIGFRGNLECMQAKIHTRCGKRFWTIKTDDRKTVSRKLRKLRVKQIWEQTDWMRSSNYREHFFKENMGPYRCRYCNKRLKKEFVQVDHVVPVGRVKRSTFARMLLKIQGIDNVNDTKNLAASCSRCNRKKKDKLGMWYVRGILGKYRIYWMVRKVMYWSMIVASAYWICRYTT